MIEEVDGLVRFKVTSSAPPTQLAGMASRSGRTRCFDQSADGFTQGEGTPQLGLAPKDHGDHDPESFLMVPVDPALGTEMSFAFYRCSRLGCALYGESCHVML